MATKENEKEFSDYLEKAGITDILTKVLVSLYDLPDKPENGVDFIKKNLGPLMGVDVDETIKQNEQLKKEKSELKKEITDLKKRVQELEKLVPEEHKEDKPKEGEVSKEIVDTDKSSSPSTEIEKTKEGS